MPDNMHLVFERLEMLKEVPELQTAVVDYFRDHKVTQPEAMLKVIDQFVAGDAPSNVPMVSEPVKTETRTPTYYAPDALPELAAPSFPEVKAEASAVISATTESPQQNPNIISGDELANVTNIISQYSGYPGIQSAFASIATANANNPERLSALMRELVDQIEQVRSNPHMHHPVNAEIAAAVEEIRKVELEKPDPLNLLRPPETPPEPAATAEKENPIAAVTNVFLATVGILAAPALMERAVEQQQTQPISFAPFDMGTSTAAVANGFPPQSLPNLISAGRDQTFSLV